MGVGYFIVFVLAGPLALGLVQMFMTVIRKNGNVEIGQLFNGFNNFMNAFVLYILNAVLIWLWSCLFVIPGIIKSYSYSMSYYILADNPDMSANDARKKSMELMKGYKWRLFCLDFSFIGWVLLSVVTFGILSFWLTPYREAAHAAFYQNILVERGLIPAEEPELTETAEVV